MAKYLIGYGSNTWDFREAYKNANAGDILVLEKNYIFEMGSEDSFTFNKDITIVGDYEFDENGTLLLNSGLTGKFIISASEVIFDNLVITSNGIKCAITSEKNATVVVKNSIVTREDTKVDKFLMYFYNSKVTIENVTLFEIANLEDNRIKFENSEVSINNTNNFGFFAVNSNVDVQECYIRLYSNHNLINAKKSKITCENCVLDTLRSDAERKTTCAIWIGENSSLILKGCEVFRKEYYSAVYIGDSSVSIIEDSILSSIYIDKSRVKISNSEILEILNAEDLSLVILEGLINIKGEYDKKIDIYCGNNSVIKADSIQINRKTNTNIRINNNSYIIVDNIICSNLELDEMKIENDDTSGYLHINASKKNVEDQTVEEKKDLKSTPKDNEKEQLEQLVGLKKVKEEIDRMLTLVDFNNRRIEQGLEPEKQSLHSIFLGNPGTGKTTVARLIGKILFDKGALSGEKFVFVEASESDLVAGYVGQTAIKTQQVLESALGGVLFIDEAYSLRKETKEHNFGIEAINTILKFMEDHRDEIMIIFAGYTKEMEQFLKTNPGLASRVPNTFDFEDYTADEIVQMGEKILEKGNYTLEDKEYYAKYVKNAYSNTLDKSNGRWIRNINEKILKVLANRVVKTNEFDITTVKNIDIDEVINQGKYQDDGKHKDAMEELEELIGIQRVKEQVKQFIALANVNKSREQQGLNTSSFSLHSLFLGNPGTGKTTVARIVGEVLYQNNIISQRKFIEVSRSDLVGQYIGHTAIKTREVLESALGGVLFIDEAYTLYKEGRDFGQEAIDEILKFMEDHRRGIVIIFAGYTKEMEDFLNTNSGLRSRVPNSFNFEDYSADEIVKIGLLGLSKFEYEINEELYETVVKELYANNNDHSNGRWIRNINEKIIMDMSLRISRNGGNVSEILDEDIIKMKESVEKNGK